MDTVFSGVNRWLASGEVPLVSGREGETTLLFPMDPPASSSFSACPPCLSAPASNEIQPVKIDKFELETQADQAQTHRVQTYLSQTCLLQKKQMQSLNNPKTKPVERVSSDQAFTLFLFEG